MSGYVYLINQNTVSAILNINRYNVSPWEEPTVTSSVSPKTILDTLMPLYADHADKVGLIYVNRVYIQILHGW